jgi:hypothetical protein
MTESELQTMVADYLVLNYPDVQFHSDFGSGCKLTKGQAIKQMRQNGGRKGWPDMFIAEPKWDMRYVRTFSGLFLELKKEGEKLLAGPRAKNRFLSIDGKEYKTEHLKEQADVIYKLNEKWYKAYFAIGFEQAKQIIDDYLGGK